MPDEEGGHFQSSQREVQTAVSSDVEMGIRRTDWRRVYRKVRSIPRETSVYEIIQSVAWGVSGSAGLSLIPLYQATEGTEPWVKPTFIVVTLTASVVALLSHHFAGARRNMIHSSCEEVLEDMQEVYATFFPNDDLQRSGS